MSTLTTTPGGSGPFTYQWFKNGVVIQNQTKNAITFPALTPADSGAYCVRVTGACGSVSNCATLTVASSIRVAVEQGNLVLSWQGSGYIVQAASALGPNASWEDVPNATNSPVRVPIGLESRFFRLRGL